MKKRLICLLGVLLVFLCCAMPALAEGTYIYDMTQTLSADQAKTQELNSRAAALSAQYECGIYTVFVQNYQAYGSTMTDAMQRIYVDNEFGYGPEKSGVMMFVSMADREFRFLAYGYGNTAFTDYGKEYLTKFVIDNLRSNDWTGAVSDYIENAGKMLQRARDGRPVDVGDRKIAERIGTPGVIIAVVILPCLIALIVCSSLKRKMKSVAKASDARFYAVPNSLELYESSDVFTHVTETRIKIESDSSRGGGGGTSVNSSGFSSGGGGKF